MTTFTESLCDRRRELKDYWEVIEEFPATSKGGTQTRTSDWVKQALARGREYLRQEFLESASGQRLLTQHEGQFLAIDCTDLVYVFGSSRLDARRKLDPQHVVLIRAL